MKSMQESIKIHSSMSHPYCWISQHNSMRLTSGSLVIWEMLSMCYMPTEDCGREKGGFGGLARWLTPHKYSQCMAEWSPNCARREYDLICAQRDFLHDVPSIAQL